MIKVCEYCSNIDIEELKETVGDKNIVIGCIENCAAYKEKAYAIINDELVVENNSNDWIIKASKMMGKKTN